MTKKELLHIVRDSRSLMLALPQPLIMLLLYGYALTLDVDRIPTYVYDQDRTPESRELIDQFRGSRYFQILGTVNDYQHIERGIDQSKILLSVVVPQLYSHHLHAGEEARSRSWSTAAIPTPPVSRWAMPRPWSKAMPPKLRSNAQVRRGGQPLRVPGRAAHPRLVQQRSQIEKLHRARAHRRHHDDDRVHAQLFDHRARVGERHHGATALHARAPH